MDNYQVGVLEGSQEVIPAMTGIIGTVTMTIILVSYVYLGCYHVEITIFMSCILIFIITGSSLCYSSGCIAGSGNYF